MNDPFDFWYAVNNTEVLVAPRKRLETFGTTVIDYHLVAELMDSVNQVRVREGRLHAFRPQIITPQAFMGDALEGFSEGQSSAYMDWLRQHEKELLIVQYGFKIRKEATNDHVVTDPLPAVVDRVKAELTAKDSPLSALLVGVDEPWEVCLLKLMVEMVQQSAPTHFQELRSDPDGSQHRIEKAFHAAAKNPALIPALAESLRKSNLFADYQDRFFALVRSARR